MNALGFIMSVHHSTYDAFSMSAFLQDLDAILSDDRGRLADRTPFTLYADTYNTYKGSVLALEDARHCATRLKGIKNCQKALWPPRKGAEWLIGNDTGWTHRNGLPGNRKERISYDREEGRLEGIAIHRKVRCPHLIELKKTHDIDASTITKAAVTLLNTKLTGQSHAIFCNLDSARSWPFLERWIADQLPNPLDVAGPTMGCTINMLPVDSNESVLAMIARIQDDQKEKGKHVNAPFSAIMDLLGDEEGEMIYDIARRQVFNWDSTARVRASNAYKSLRLLGRQGWLDLGVFWNFGLADEETLAGFVMYDDAHRRYVEAAEGLDEVLKLASWMTEPDNWGKRVGDSGKVP